MGFGSVAEANRVARLLEPSSIAICGASDRSRWSSTIFQNLRDGGFSGPIALVNPKGGTVHGQAAVKSCSDLGRPVDLGIVMVPRDAVLAACTELANIGAASAMILTSGFAETGAEGALLQSELRTLSKTRGLSLLGPNSLGFINHAGNVTAWATPTKRSNRTDGVAIVSQSGATALFLSQFAEEQNIGLSHVVATGNEADLESTAFIEHFLDLPNVRSIAFFCETVRDPLAFLRCVKKALRLGKAIVVLKVGRSAITAASAESHTGALVGDDKVFDGICQQYGVIRVDSIEDLIVTADLAAFTGVLRPGGLAVLSNSGGICEIAADKAHIHNVTLPPLSQPTLTALNEMLPSYGTPHNPLDLTGGIDPAQTQKIVELVGNQEDVAAVLCPYYRVPNEAAEVSVRLSELHNGLAAGLNGIPIPGLLVSYASTNVTDFAREIIAAQQLPYKACGLDRAISALAHIMTWSTRQRSGLKIISDTPTTTSVGERRPRSEFEVLAWIALQGVPVVPMSLVTTREEAVSAVARLGTVAVKVASPDIAHKSDIGGVVLNVEGSEQAGQAFDQVTTAARMHHPHAQVDGAVVSPMRRGGVEMFVGVRRDPQWGLVLAVGLGGIFVEILEDVSLRVLPVDADDIRSMIDQLKGKKMLEGARGAAPADIDALADAVVAICTAATSAGPDLMTLEINPLRVDGSTVEALDGLIEWSADLDLMKNVERIPA